MYVLCVCVIKHLLTIRVTWRVFYKRQELLTLRYHQGSFSVVGSVRVAHLVSLCFVFCCCFCLSSSCVLCAQWCQFLWMANYLFLLRFSFTFVYICVCYLHHSISRYKFYKGTEYNGTIGTEYKGAMHNRTEISKPLLATDQCTIRTSLKTVSLCCISFEG
jgi:hypothetical protein